MNNIERPEQRIEDAVRIRPAATLLNIRDTPHGIEVFALQRSAQMRFLPGHIAFPGGTLDNADWGILDDGGEYVQAQQHSDDTAYAVGALRECAEEVGWLCALRLQSGVVRDVSLTFAEQQRLLDNQVGFWEVVQSYAAGLAFGRLRFVGRWVTPAGMPAHFDTRFFLHVMTDGALKPSVSRAENDWGDWIRPQETLNQIESGDVQAVPPTIAMLRGLTRFQSTADCFASFDVPGPDPI